MPLNVELPTCLSCGEILSTVPIGATIEEVDTELYCMNENCEYYTKSESEISKDFDNESDVDDSSLRMERKYDNSYDDTEYIEDFE